KGTQDGTYYISTNRPNLNKGIDAHSDHQERGVTQYIYKPDKTVGGRLLNSASNTLDVVAEHGGVGALGFIMTYLPGLGIVKLLERRETPRNVAAADILRQINGLHLSIGLGGPNVPPQPQPQPGQQPPNPPAPQFAQQIGGPGGGGVPPLVPQILGGPGG